MYTIKVPEISVERAISEATRVLNDGGILAYPTETFFGLGARFDNVYALERLYEIKKRPFDKAMPLLVGKYSLLSLIASSVGPEEIKLMEHFWPGPLTILLNAREGLPSFVTSKERKIAVRIPGRSFALDLVQSLDFPITATSANISGELPLDDPEDVLRHFGDSVDLLINCGKTRGGKPSTIAEVKDGRVSVLRHGSIPDEEILGIKL